jgi:hypothetical protein
MPLTDLCGGTAAQLQALDLSALMDRCMAFAPALDPSKNTAALVIGIIFAVVTAVAVLIHRLVTKDSAAAVVLESLEATIFGAGAGYAGAAAGVIIAQLASPLLLGLLFLIVAGVAVLFGIVAMVRGDADAGWKVLGFFHFLILGAGLATIGVICLMVPRSGAAGDAYHTYILVVAIGLGITSGINAIFASIQRGNFYVVGVVFLIINGSWGFIGNLLGLMTHFASIYAYKDFGVRHTGSQRICFVCYETGFSLKSNSAGRFAFTQGAVMSADTTDLRKHEGIHVAQHYLFGPIYPLSHFLWFIVMIIPGLIGAATKSLAADEGITRMSYYDNPYEVMAYGIINPSGRNTADDLIWNWVPATFVAVIYALVMTGLFILLLALRLNHVL